MHDEIPSFLDAGLKFPVGEGLFIHPGFKRFTYAEIHTKEAGEGGQAGVTFLLDHRASERFDVAFEVVVAVPVAAMTPKVRAAKLQRPIATVNSRLNTGLLLDFTGSR